MQIGITHSLRNLESTYIYNRPLSWSPSVGPPQLVTLSDVIQEGGKEERGKKLKFRGDKDKFGLQYLGDSLPLCTSPCKNSFLKANHHA